MIQENCETVKCKMYWKGALKCAHFQLRTPQPLKFLIGNDALLFTMPGARRLVDEKGKFEELKGESAWGSILPPAVRLLH